MEENISYNSLLILSLFAFLTPLFLSRFKKIKIPSVVGEILVGILIGKSFFNLIEADIWIIFLSNLGLAYLMFLSGLEIDTDSFKFSNKEERKKSISSIGICLLMYIISLGVSFLFTKLLFNLGVVNNIPFFTLLFTASAPGLIVPYLKERNLLQTAYGQTILIYSLVCEFICLIAITIIASSIEFGLSKESFTFIIVFLVSILIYILAKNFLEVHELELVHLENQHIDVRAAFALILVLVTVSSMAKSEIVLGSFLGGLIFALIAKRDKEDLMYKLDIIGYGFLIPIFFIMIGVNLDIKTIFYEPKNLLYLPLFVLIIFIVKLIPSLVLFPIYGVNKSISASIISTAQLSLMIVSAQIALNLELLDQSGYSLFIVTTVISCILFPIFFDKFFNSEGIEMPEKEGLDRICTIETVISNNEICNIPLKDLRLPEGCKIFLINRDSREILPDGHTSLKQGDKLVLAGLSDESKKMISILHGK